MKPRFGTVAALSKMKRFCPRWFERCPIKNASFVTCTAADLYLARARARARAPALQSWAPPALVHHRVSASILARAAVLCDWIWDWLTATTSRWRNDWRCRRTGRKRDLKLFLGKNDLKTQNEKKSRQKSLCFFWSFLQKIMNKWPFCFMVRLISRMLAFKIWADAMLTRGKMRFIFWAKSIASVFLLSHMAEDLPWKSQISRDFQGFEMKWNV